MEQFPLDKPGDGVEAAVRVGSDAARRPVDRGRSQVIDEAPCAHGPVHPLGQGSPHTGAPDQGLATTVDVDGPRGAVGGWVSGSAPGHGRSATVSMLGRGLSTRATARPFGRVLRPACRPSTRRWTAPRRTDWAWSGCPWAAGA